MYKTDGNWRKNLFYVVPEAENGFGTCYIDIIAQTHSERNKIFILLRSLCSGVARRGYGQLPLSFCTWHKIDS